MAKTLAEAARRLNSPPPGRGGRCRSLPALYLMTAPRLPDPVAAARRLPRGAAVVLRHYDAPDRAKLAEDLARVARERGLTLLVAGDWRLAAAVGAGGLHLPEGLARHGLLAPALAWRRRSGALLTVAAHGERALRQAERLGADAVFLSPVFPTHSHPGAPTLGPVRFAALAGAASLPVIALGGLTATTVQRLQGTVAGGVAAVSALG